MWQEAKEALFRRKERSRDQMLAQSGAEHEAEAGQRLGHCEGGSDSGAAQGESQGERSRGGETSDDSTFAAVIQAMMAANLKKATSETDCRGPPPPIDVGVDVGGEKGDGDGVMLMGGEVSPTDSVDDSDRTDRRQRFAGLGGLDADGDVDRSNAGMRQESYYLRGRVEEDRDAQLLNTIEDCIPGRTRTGGRSHGHPNLGRCNSSTLSEPH